jgi:hypothetical protein
MREGKHHVRAIAHQVLRLSVALALAASLASCFSSIDRPSRSERGDADEILRLSTQIQQWRTEMGLSCDPVRAELLSFAQPELVAFARPPDRFAACSANNDDACSVVLAICDNAEAICQLAGERGNDTWSNDKCVSAKRSCRDAGACVE